MFQIETMEDGDKILLDDQDYDQLKDQASDFLKSGYFFAAQQFYKKLLETQPDNKDFHIAYLMAQNSFKEEKDLIIYYQDLFSKPEYETRKATEKESSHIEDMAERLYIPDYLEKDEIRKAYEYDLTYQSCLSCRLKQKDEILKLIDDDDHLFWLKKKGFREISDIVKAYDRRIDEAETEDKNNADNIRNDYQRFLYQTYSRIKDLNRKAQDRKDDNYKELVDRFDKSNDIEELRDLSLRFESFGDYRKAENYVSLCKEKIDELKKQSDDVYLKEEIEKAIAKARTALLRKRFGEAYDGFAKVVALDQDNEDAHLGILMSQTKTSDIDELFDYYGNLYVEDKKEKLEAVEEDRKHIEEMAEKYCLPDYLDKETIREKYVFDRSYLSSLSNRLKQEAQLREELEANPVFLWLSKNGSDKTKKRIEDLFSAYQNRAVQAKEEDDKNIERIRNEYQRFLFKTYADIKKLHTQANERKDEEYKEIIRSYSDIDDEDELNDLIRRLEALGDFKESEKYISLISNRIDSIREKENNLHIQQEIETILIAARSYLLAGNTVLANQSFDKVLSLDNGNPYAYLGILMIETGSKDQDELVRYYQDLYSDNISETLEGCQADRSHIDEIADRYYLPSYFEKDTIRKYYNFDRSYESYTSSRIQQKKQIEEEFELNPLFVKINERKDDEIKQLFDRIFDAYDERIRQSKQADQKQCRSIEHIYQIYLKETDRTIEKIYDEKLKERNDDCETHYKENVNEYFETDDPDKLEELIARFEKDKDYKDSADYIDRCKEKIRQLRIENEQDTLDALFEEGDDLIEKRLFNQAKEKFISYLDIDPENEDAHLYLLMAETQTSDIDSLFDYYKQLYFYDDRSETIEAVEERKDHIEEMCEKCYIPDELEKDEIRDVYRFDRTFESSLSFRIDEKQQMKEELEFNPSLEWLKNKGSAKVRDYIDDLLNTYEDRIRQSRKEDQANTDAISKEYRNFVRNKDREIRSLYNSILKEKNDEARRSEKEKKESELRQKEETERERKRREEREKAEAVEIETERQKQEESERERKRRLSEQAELEKQAQRRLERERKKQEKKARRPEKVVKPVKEKKERAPFRPNIGVVMAIISLIVFGVISYLYWWTPTKKYNNAVSLAEEGRYDEAIAAFEELGDYRDSVYKAKETAYLKADSYYVSGDLIAAANAFKDLRFDDSEDRLTAIKEQLMSKAEIGSEVIFGEYEQDGNLENGKELLEWTVLDKREGEMLLISKYGIDAQKFNSSSESVTWMNSTLRSWLNGRFPDNAFISESPSAVLQTTLTNVRIADYVEDEYWDENDIEEYETRDRIFLLNDDELDLYFPEEESRICKATPYAIEYGVAASSDDSCSWWLRSPDLSRRDMTMIVRGSDGSLGSSVFVITNAVRPAMWIKAE